VRGKKKEIMPAKFKVGDKVTVPEGTEDAQEWWWGKEATVRAILEDGTMYEVLFTDAEDFAFIEERLLEPAARS
jgi:hypothetical protein